MVALPIHSLIYQEFYGFPVRARIHLKEAPSIGAEIFALHEKISNAAHVLQQWSRGVFAPSIVSHLRTSEFNFLNPIKKQDIVCWRRYSYAIVMCNVQKFYRDGVEYSLSSEKVGALLLSL